MVLHGMFADSESLRDVLSPLLSSEGLQKCLGVLHKAGSKSSEHSVMFRSAQRFRAEWTFEGFLHCDLGWAAGVFEALRSVEESHHLQQILAKVAIWHNGRLVISTGYFYPCNGVQCHVHNSFGAALLTVLVGSFRGRAANGRPELRQFGTLFL